MQKLVNIQEVASVLGLSVKTVRRRIAAGKFPVIQTGGQGTALRFDLDDVMRIVKGLPTVSEISNVSHDSEEEQLSGPPPQWKKTTSKKKGSK